MTICENFDRLLRTSLLIDFETAGLDCETMLEVTMLSEPLNQTVTIRLPVWMPAAAALHNRGIAVESVFNPCDAGAWGIHVKSGVLKNAAICSTLADFEQKSLESRARIQAFIMRHAEAIRERPRLCGFSPHFDLKCLSNLRRIDHDGGLDELVSHRVIDIGTIAEIYGVQKIGGDHTSAGDVVAVAQTINAIRNEMRVIDLEAVAQIVSSVFGVDETTPATGV